MKRNTPNFLIDLLSFLSLAGLIFTAIIIRYILPPGSGGRHGRGFRGGRGLEETSEHIREFWSLGRHDWGDIHFYIAILFAVLMIIHIILHWTWIKCYIKSLFVSSVEKSH